MFLVLIEYKVPFEEVEPHVASHIDFVKSYVEKHKFVLTAKKVPRTGGVVLANFESKEELILVLKEDPFWVHDLANFDIIELQISQVSEALLMK